jgi:hypothetical protein
VKLTTTLVLICSLLLIGNVAFAQDPGDNAAPLTATEAEAIVLEHYPDTSVVLVEREFDDDTQLWDVKLNNGLAVYVNAQSGAIVELEPWQGEWDGIDLANFVLPIQDVEPIEVGNGGVDFLQAEAIALRYYPGASVVALELDDDNEFFAWDVMLNNGMAVYIHTETGEVLEFEMWTGEWRNTSDDGTPPWAGFPGGRRAWETQRASETPADTTASTADSITAVEAQQIALQLFPSMTVTDIERDVEYGIPVWDIELSNGVSIEIAIADGTIVEISDAGQDWENPAIVDQTSPAPASGQPGSGSDGITSAQAQQIALNQFPGTTVVDVETDTEYGVPVWDVELSNGVSLDISRIDGTIIEIYGSGQDSENPAYDDDRWEDDQSADDDWSESPSYDEDDWDDEDDWQDEDWNDDDDDDWDDDDDDDDDWD